MDTVCMLHPGRCGSTVVATQLEAMPKVKWLGEVITLMNDHREGKLKYWLATHDSELDRMIGGRENFKALGRILGNMLSSTKHVGFELKIFRDDNAVLSQTKMSFPESIDLLLKLGITKFIALSRKNCLRTITSKVRAYQSGTWHIRRSDQTNNVKPLKTFELPLDGIDYGPQKKLTLTEAMRAIAADQDTMHDSLLSKGVDFLKLEYAADILPNPQIAHDKIAKFLDVEANHASTDLVRTNPFPLRDSLTNFVDVQRLLEQSEFGWMLTDPLEEGVS